MLANIFSSTEQVVLFVTVAELYPGAQYHESMPTLRGSEKSVKAGQGFQRLVDEIEKSFGRPQHFSSWFPGAIITACSLFSFPKLTTSELLNPAFDFETFRKGHWIARQKRLDRHHLLQALLLEPEISEERFYLNEAMKIRQFACQPEKFKVALTFEPLLSLGLRGFVPDSELGLLPCEGALVQVSSCQIVAAESVKIK